VHNAAQRCFLTHEERLKIVVGVGRYAPGITNIRQMPRCDIIAIYNELARLLELENKER
jgi:hypothetical protein